MKALSVEKILPTDYLEKPLDFSLAESVTNSNAERRIRREIEIGKQQEEQEIREWKHTLIALIAVLLITLTLLALGGDL